MEKPLQYVRNVWLEGQGAICISIPIEIVKKMNIDQNSFLYIEMVDDSTFGAKKITHKLSKDEISNIQKINIGSEENNFMETMKTPEIKTNTNLLDGLDL